MAINFFNSLAVGTNVLYVDTLNDRVGIGTSTPGTGTNLHVLTGTGSGQIKLQSQANTQFQFYGNGNQDINYGRPANFPSPPGDTYGQIRYSHSSDYMAFKVNNSERMRIDSSGVVQVRNVDSPTLQLFNTDASLTSNQVIGDIDFYQSDPSGSGVGVVSKIRSINSSSFQGEAGLAFHTGTTSGLTERMRITSVGQIGVGISSPTSNGGVTAKVLHIHNPNTAEWAVTHYTNGSTGSAGGDGFLVGNIGSDSYLYNYENANLIFGTNGSERVRIDSSGRVGIGLTPYTTSSLLNLKGDGLALKNDENGGDNNWSLIQNLATGTQSSIDFTTGQGLAMTISHDKNVGIGTTSPDSLLNIEGVKNTAILTLGNTTNDSSWSVGDKIGGINFYSADGSGAGSGVKASLSYEVSAGSTSSTNAMVFRTAGITSGTNNTERMRIDSSGNVGIGGTADSDYRIHLYKSTNSEMAFESTGTNGGFYRIGTGHDASGFGGAFRIYDMNASAERMRIDSSGQAYFNSSTDYKIGLNDAFGAIQWWLKAYTNGDFGIHKNGGGDRVTIKSSGFVGIGTSTPSDRLNVVGTIRAQGHLINGSANAVRTCTYSPENIFMSGKNNSVGGQNNAAIGSNNQIQCSSAPWLQLGGNLIAGMNNTINTGYSHANAVFGQNNTLANTVTQQAEAGSLMSGDGNILFGTNSFSWGYQTFAQAGSSLTGGYQSVSFGNSGSMSVGLGCTASTGATQYAFGTGVTTPTTATAAEISNQFAIGKFNVYATSIGHLFAIGNGTSDGARNTALAVIGEGAYTNGQLSLNDVNGYSSSTYNSRLHISGNATKTTGSSWISVSDERLKSNIQVYEKGLSEILQITPKTFEFNGKAGTQAGQSQVGIIAQEIKDILPESINTFNKKLEETDETETELYDFNQDPLVYTLLNAVKELSAKIDTLENKIQTLEAN